MKLSEQEILRKVTKLLFPFVIMFGVYVITHGEIGPGGGFQGGVIVASAYILCALVFGLDTARALLPRGVCDVLAACGVLIYAGVGVATLINGGTFLEYDRLMPSNPVVGQAIGMTVVEIGVGLTVAAVMVILFSEMVRRPEPTPAGGE